MQSLFAVPAVVLLIGFPGFGVKRTVAVAPADTLPPAWKSASMLALESQFVRPALPSLQRRSGGLRLNSAYDPRRLLLTVDPAAGEIRSAASIADVTLGAATRTPIESYAQELTRQTFRRQWEDQTRQSINLLGQTSGIGSTGSTGLSFKFPSPLPKRIQSFLGPGGPALTVAGSENIRLSGTSNWTNQELGILGQSRSLFPSLDMQQDLDIRLEGQLSDRIRVNLLQNSGIQIPLANRLYINYRGDEDDLVQALDLGNTNLTLPGTQYVSYSGKNEGLFGVKSSMRLGPLDFTILASKQEGRSERASYSGGATSQFQTLADLDYVKGAYFFMYDPNQSNSLFIPDSSITVYLDDYRYDNDTGNEVRGRGFLDPTFQQSADTSSVRGSFRILNKGADQDYEISQNYYGPFYKVIHLRSAVSGEQRLGVTYTAFPVDAAGNPDYSSPILVGGQSVAAVDTVGGVGVPVTERWMKLLRAPGTSLKPDAQGNFDTTLALVRTRELELKSIYQLSGQNIDLSSFKLTVRKGVDDPPITFLTTPASGDTAIPYVEAVGLDNYNESQGANVRGHDGKIDGVLPATNSRLFLDPENGTLFMVDLRPFAPRLDRPFDQLLDGLLLRRVRLDGPADSANAANALIYDKYNVQRALDSRYYMDVEFNAQRAVGEINLGRGNILEGSDVVAINGAPLQRDRDYTIDYDLGRVVLKRQLGPADRLSIDYSYAPLFQQAGRTLIGSAFRMEGRDKSLGGAFMYESKGAQDLRPRLGEEPSRSVIGDLNTEFLVRPSFLTRAVDLLPLVRTTIPSEMRVQAEVGASFPNPNTKNEVYIDDMEGVRDAVTLSMGIERWRNTSPPLVRNSSGSPISILDVPQKLNAEIRWYSPPNSFEQKDQKPKLSEAQGARNKLQVLALSVPRRPAASLPGDSLWVGLTYPLDQVGLDLSRSQFIEIWINDFNDYHEGFLKPRVRGHNVKLHIDVGVVSEDQMRSPDVRPNGRLDTEDQPPLDNQLSVIEGNDEDTGYDGIVDAVEIDSLNGVPLDLSTADETDPEGDNFQTVNTSDFPEDIDTRRYRFVNGTERSKTINPTPDTEDLNLNRNLDQTSEYFEFTVDLGDSTSPYLETDVQRDYKNDATVAIPIDNGWRRYRIPLADVLRGQFGTPDLTIARNVRIWLDGIIDTDPDPATVPVVRPLAVLGGVEIVGSRWQAADLEPSQLGNGTTITLTSVNSLDDADIYVPPFDPGSTRSGNQELSRREQSIVLEFTRLQPDDTLEVFKTLSLFEDYSRYGKLDWYATGFRVARDDGRYYRPDLDTLYYYVRFTSDDLGLNYYEYKAPVPAVPGDTTGRINWSSVSIPLTLLSNLKLNPDFPSGNTSATLYRAPGPNGNDSLIVSGRPSFTRLRRISFGLINPSLQQVYDSGQLWFDELRSTDVAKDKGYAKRLQVSGNFASLLRYNISWDGRDANFVTVGQSRGSGNSVDQLNLGGTFDMHRFFEASGVILPVTLGYGRNSSKPRFTAGDDVLRTGALAEASETRYENRTFATSYARAWSERSSPLLRYTIGGITGNYNRSTSDGVTPTTTSNSINTALGVNYAIAPRNLLRLPVPLSKSKLYLLPERVYASYTNSTTQNTVFQRTADGTGLIPSSAVRGQSAFINMGSDIRPLDFLHHHIEAVRNLNLGDLNEKPGGINIGRVVNWRQNMDARFALNRGDWLNPTLSWAANYAQDNRPELSPDLSVRAIGNGQNYTFTWSLPFDRLGRPATRTPVAPTGPVDTSAAARAAVQRRSAMAPIGMALSRLGNISIDAAYDRNSAYSRLIGMPSPAYLFGVSNNPGFVTPEATSPSDTSGRVRALLGNSISLGENIRGAARTRFLLALDASVQARAEFNQRTTQINGVATRVISTRFPDLDFEYGRMAAVMRLNRILQNPRLRTAYSRSQSKDYRQGLGTPTGISTSSQWQPLLSLDGDLRNQTRLGFKVERRVTARENFQLGHSLATDRNTDINLSLNRTFTRGQKVKILTRETTVKSTVTLGATAAYSRRSGETLQLDNPGLKPQFPIDQDRLSVNLTGAYSFSSNITGNGTLGFGQNRDLQRDIITRSVRVELRASFTF